jgi:hypothetical protein
MIVLRRRRHHHHHCSGRSTAIQARPYVPSLHARCPRAPRRLTRVAPFFFFLCSSASPHPTPHVHPIRYKPTRPFSPLRHPRRAHGKRFPRRAERCEHARRTRPRSHSCRPSRHRVCACAALHARPNARADAGKNPWTMEPIGSRETTRRGPGRGSGKRPGSGEGGHVCAAPGLRSAGRGRNRSSVLRVAPGPYLYGRVSSLLAHAPPRSVHRNGGDLLLGRYSSG